METTEEKDSSTVEQLINAKIAEVLRSLRPQWKRRVDAESSHKDSKGGRRQPDILIEHPNGLLLAIESEIRPDVSKVVGEAEDRVGKPLPGGTQIVEQAIALCIPEHLKNKFQDDLDDEIRKVGNGDSEEIFEYCVVSERGRWPEKGWIGGG